MPGIRIIQSFESNDANTLYSIPRRALEMDIAQAYRQTIAAALGQDYAIDMFGVLPWPKMPGQLVSRWLIASETEIGVDAAFATMLATIRKIGRGKLFTIGADGTRQWCYAKSAQRPQGPAGWNMPFWVPVQALWTTFSDWMAATPTTGTVVITASGQTFTITNPGNAVVKGAGCLSLRLRANTSGGIVTPTIANSTTVQQIASATGSASANSELFWEPELNRFRYSNDDGSSYVTDWANITIPPAQGPAIDLLPGANLFTYTGGGSPNLNLDYSFYPKYEM